MKPPDVMTGRSLWKVLQSDKSGMVDESRTFSVSGRERHVAGAREGNLPYPQRSIRTKDFLYIRNFKPDRWPLGSPVGVTDTSEPDAKTLGERNLCRLRRHGREPDEGLADRAPP